MRLRSLCVALAGIILAGLLGHTVSARDAARVANRIPVPEADTVEKFTFFLFWKEDNAASRRMAETLKSSVGKRADRATWTGVNVADPANGEIVEQYKLSRTPMPLVLCIAPNGAVTGAFPRPFNDADVERALVTPTMTRCMKALQANKIVCVHVKPAANAPLPSCATQFAADPDFQARTELVSFTIDDPAEARFLKDMDINPAAVRGSIVSVLAPPGSLVGKFSESATKTHIINKLHAAGKCCNDPNCKHNRK